MKIGFVLFKNLCFVFMLFAFIGCNADKKNENKQKVAKEIVVENMVFTSYTDSLEYIVKVGSPEEQLEALNSLYFFYQNSDISKALQYAWQQKDLADNL